MDDKVVAAAVIVGHRVMGAGAGSVWSKVRCARAHRPSGPGWGRGCARMAPLPGADAADARFLLFLYRKPLSYANNGRNQGGAVCLRQYQSWHCQERVGHESSKCVHDGEPAGIRLLNLGVTGNPRLTFELLAADSERGTAEQELCSRLALVKSGHSGGRTSAPETAVSLNSLFAVATCGR